MAQSQSHFFKSNNPHDFEALQDFFCDIAQSEQVLIVMGGGTAALTYLYTHDIEPQFTHIVILGKLGFWQTAAHRLAQPSHILALPNIPSDKFINPAEHDEINNILPHQSRSAYVDSHAYQHRLAQFEKATLASLESKGKKVFIARDALVKKIERLKPSFLKLDIEGMNVPIFANKLIIASGAGPARKLSVNVQKSLLASLEKEKESPNVLNKMILDYTHILGDAAEQCRDKVVLIYGGGGAAAWAMEVACLIAKPVAWVATNGFDEARGGSRVNGILKQTRSAQVNGKIDTISYTKDPVSGESKLLVKVIAKAANNTSETKYLLVDCLINCIGQEQYEIGGLAQIISPKIKNELVPYLDKNFVTGAEQSCMLGWATQEGDLMIIGAAHDTYYDRNKPLQLPFTSHFLPKSGQALSTIGGVVSSVCALTNYMPVSQDPNTGVSTLQSMNVNVMNATQLAVYFTTCYPNASATEVNKAVSSFISQRAQTEFGLSEQELSEFLSKHFGELTSQTSRVSRAKL